MVGKLRLLTSPPDAEILIDGRRIGVGSVVDRVLPAGARRLRIQAAGYQTFDTLVVIPADSTVILGRITLHGRGTGT